MSVEPVWDLALREDLLSRQRPGGLPCLPDQHLMESNHPQALSEFERVIRPLVERHGAEIWTIRPALFTSDVWYYQDQPFLVSLVGDTVRAVPTQTYLRLQGLLAEGIQPLMCYWADERPAPVPFVVTPRTAPASASTPQARHGFWHGVKHVLGGNDAQPGTTRQWRDPMAVIAVGPNGFATDLVYIIVGKWFELH